MGESREVGDQALVVRTLDIAIHRITESADKCQENHLRYPLDSNLSRAQENRGRQGYGRGRGKSGRWEF